MRKALTVAIIAVMLFGSLALLPAPTARATETQDNDTIIIETDKYIDTEQPINQYFILKYKDLYLPIRTAVFSSSNSWSASSWQMTVSNITSGKHLELYYSDARGYVRINIDFVLWKDAQGDDTILMNATAETDNATAFNKTAFILYTGANSTFDTELFDYIYNHLPYYYIGLERSIIPYANGKWLLFYSTWGRYIGSSYSWPNVVDSYETPTRWNLAGFTIAATDSPTNNELHAALKVITPLAHPHLPPKTMMLNPFLNYSRWAEYDNETIYKEASEKYHIQRLILWDNWFKTPSYDVYNAEVEQHLNNIIAYAHKYNIEVGMYFGWRDGTSYGWYHPLNTYNESAVNAALNSWAVWKNKWYDKVDFIAWDYAGFKYPDSWSYWNWWYITKIWKTIDKPIVYNNGIGTPWYLGDNFIPMLWESNSSWVKAHDAMQYENFIGVLHWFNYPHLIFSKSTWDSSLPGEYNSTIGNEHVQQIREFGGLPIPLYHYQGIPGWTPNIDQYADYRGETVMYKDIQGDLSGVQLEREHDVFLLLSNPASQITVTPHIAKLPVKIYTNKSVTIEYEITPTSNLVVKDLTTGKTVSWEKGSIIFTAQAGHTYEIYNQLTQAINISIDWTYAIVNAMIPIAIFAVLLSALTQILQAVRKSVRFRK